MVYNYDGFVASLLEAGFSLGGHPEGIYAVIPWIWGETAPYETPVAWHTGNRETDPWEWRIRVLNERDDIAYGKLFFGKSGYITREWYPYFLAARRRGRSFDESYDEGLISNEARQIYEAVTRYGPAPVQDIRHRAGFDKEGKSRFDKALIELQMKLYLTISGSSRKRDREGGEYGWPSTGFMTTEQFFGQDVFAEALSISKERAAEAIRDQVLRLNPEAKQKKILSFIEGR